MQLNTRVKKIDLHTIGNTAMAHDIVTLLNKNPCRVWQGGRSVLRLIADTSYHIKNINKLPEESRTRINTKNLMLELLKKEAIRRLREDINTTDEIRNKAVGVIRSLFK